MSDTVNNETPFERVARLISTAFTIDEVAEARAALREFTNQHPEYVGSDTFHGFRWVVWAAEEREEDARDRGLTAAEIAEREALLKENPHIVDPINNASDRAKMEPARERLQAWLERYPDDPIVKSYLRIIESEFEYVRVFLEQVGSFPTDHNE